jgi:hypothetical protein
VIRNGRQNIILKTIVAHCKNKMSFNKESESPEFKNTVLAA